MATLVVGRDGNIDILGGRVGVAEGNNGDVDVGSLLDGLGIGAGIGDNDQAGLLERAGDVVGERTGGEATGDGLGTGVGGELQDGTLAIGTSTDDANIGRVVNGGDDTGSENDLLPVELRESAILSLLLSSNAISSSPTSRFWIRGFARLHVPGLANVDDVDTVGTSLPEVRLHVNLKAIRKGNGISNCVA